MIYDVTTKIYETESCGICLDSFTENKDCLLLKCGHIFHKTCIKIWNEHAVEKVCPFCKKEFLILPTTLEELPKAARKSATVAGVIFAYIAAPFLGILSLIGLGHILKQGPDVIDYIRNNMSIRNQIEHLLNQESKFSADIADYLTHFMANIGNYLTSGTDPEILRNNPPLIDLSEPGDFALFLLVLGALAITVTTAGFLIKHRIHQYKMRDRLVQQIQYNGPPSE